MPVRTRSILQVLCAVASRPRLWLQAIRSARHIIGQPGASEFALIPADYLRFRLETVSGGSSPDVSATDVVDWLKWARRFRRVVE